MAPTARPERKLPVQQLAILAICRFAEPIATTSLFPYLPEMIRSFGIPQDEVGKWAGICAAAFSLSQAIMGIPWGLASDKYGRKPAILIGLTSTMITTLMWGFSTSLPMAIIARALQGAGNGNVGILRTMVAEMVPFKELQPRAFSLMPLVWVTGSILGPTLGGSLTNPLGIKPEERFMGTALLERFPYALPNLASSLFFTIGIAVGFLYLKETLETKRLARDRGLEIGEKIKSLAGSYILKAKNLIHLRRSDAREDSDAETEPLLKPDVENAALIVTEPTSAPILAAPSLRSVLNPQACMNLLVYTLLAAHSMAFDQLLPVFMQYPTLQSHPLDQSSHNPLKFVGGFGLPAFRIGLISTAYGIFGMLFQFFLFPRLARYYGILPCLRLVVLVFPLTYIATPFTALLPTQTARVAACFLVMLVKCFCGIFAFPCSTILLTNSASSLRVLGTLNGFATAFSAIGRGMGPLIAGWAFTRGVKEGFIIVPWWLLAALAFLAAIPVFWLVEGNGFGDDDANNEADEAEDETDEATPNTLTSARRVSMSPDPPPFFPPPSDRQSSTSPLFLSRTTSHSLGLESPELGPERSRSAQTGRHASRRSSIPIGMGRPLTRKYSSNLGQSLGSAGGFGG